MARTRNSWAVKFNLVNFIELAKALESFDATPYKLKSSDVLTSLDKIVYEQTFYAMKGMAISEFDDHLILFNDDEDDECDDENTDDEINEDDEINQAETNENIENNEEEEGDYNEDDGEKVIMSHLFGEYELPQVLERKCFADYRMFGANHEKVWKAYKGGFIHPVYLFRYVELCEFDTEVNDRVLLRVLGDEYRKNMEDSSEEDEEEEVDERPQKKTKVNKEEISELEKERKLIKYIREETLNIDWDDRLLKAYRQLMHSINPIVDEDDEEEMLNDEKLPDLSLLQNDNDMLYCILEYNGHVKTLFNFAISNHAFYEIFKKANRKNLLLKRIVKDWGLVF